MHHPENIEGQEEKDSGSVEMQFKRHFLAEFRPIRGVDFEVIAIVV